MAKRVPEFVNYTTVDEYYCHYKREYCDKEIYTSDGIRVHFHPSTFFHAFGERSNPRSPHKDRLSEDRAQRIDWVGATLATPDSSHSGWKSSTGSDDFTSRVDVFNQFVVVLQYKLGKRNSLKSEFKTCYPASTRTFKQISGHPRWSEEKCVEELLSQRKRKGIKKRKKGER